jgi:hypothetical protein
MEQSEQVKVLSGSQSMQKEKGNHEWDMEVSKNKADLKVYVRWWKAAVSHQREVDKVDNFLDTFDQEKRSITKEVEEKAKLRDTAIKEKYEREYQVSLLLKGGEENGRQLVVYGSKPERESFFASWQTLSMGLVPRLLVVVKNPVFASLYRNTDHYRFLIDELPSQFPAVSVRRSTEEGQLMGLRGPVGDVDNAFAAGSLSLSLCSHLLSLSALTSSLSSLSSLLCAAHLLDLLFHTVYPKSGRERRGRERGRERRGRERRGREMYGEGLLHLVTLFLIVVKQYQRAQPCGAPSSLYDPSTHPSHQQTHSEVGGP